MRQCKIIFDLDGTLLDTGEGICNSVRYVEKKLGLRPLPEKFLKTFVGPPPVEMYARYYNLSEEKALEAVHYHREYGNKYGIYEFSIYPGIVDCLTMLREDQFFLYVATLKRERVAKQILSNAGLKKYFEEIIGMDDEEKMKKNEMLLKIIGDSNARDVILVGDSKYDFESADKTGIRFLPVLYGYGFNDNNITMYSKTLGVAYTPVDIYRILKREKG